MSSKGGVSSAEGSDCPGAPGMILRCPITVNGLAVIPEGDGGDGKEIYCDTLEPKPDGKTYANSDALKGKCV